LDELVEHDPAGDAGAAAANGWWTWRAGSSAANCTHRGSRINDGRAGTRLQIRAEGENHLPILAAMSDVYKALADPTRRAILDELSERDGQTLLELCTRLAAKHGLGSPRQAISQHLLCRDPGRSITLTTYCRRT
jgi:hypothetical protein